MGLSFPSPVVGKTSQIVHTISLTSLPLSKIISNMANKKNPNAVALGTLGGKARAAKLSKAKRSEIATKAAKARSAKLSAADRKRIAMLAVQARERKRKENA
jgi:hypothetical protein